MKLRAAFIAVFLVFVDQLTKTSASAYLSLHESRPVFKNILHLTLIHNSGAAFGFFKEGAALFIFISLVTVLLILFYAKKFGHSYRYARAGLLLILAGTIGNLIDRVRFGYVVDFIDLRIWPVFNFADILISSGGLLLIYYLISSKRNP